MQCSIQVEQTQCNVTNLSRVFISVNDACGLALTLLRSHVFVCANIQRVVFVRASRLDRTPSVWILPTISRAYLVLAFSVVLEIASLIYSEL